jgi:N-acetylglucosaminyldiphosphoundecaprenol N-acetyl-beta-D-mannosaminyltransferase
MLGTRGARAHILGCEIDRLDMAAAVERCDGFITQNRLGQHVAVNAAKLVAVHKDRSLREIVNRCELVTADGQAVVWASRLLGDPLPSRVAGIDLMWELFALAERRRYRLFILGASADVLARAVEQIRTRHPGLLVAGTHDGYFPAEQEAAVAAEIAAARPHMLFVAMSSPRKEYFLSRHGRTLGVPLIMGVGGAIDVAAGVTRRAPPVMQRAGLEWLVRLAQEPRRLFRRYLVTNSRFIALVAADWVRHVLWSIDVGSRRWPPR